MVTRVASFGQHENLLAQLMRNMSRKDDTQNQVSTGKAAYTFSGIGSDTERLLAARSAAARDEQYLADSKRMQNVAKQHSSALDQQRTVGKNLVSALDSAVASTNGVTLMQAVDDALANTIRVLNLSVDGKYIFGGTRTDVPPVRIANRNDLVGLARISDAFANGRERLSAQIDDGRVVSFGALADDVGAAYLSTLKSIYDFAATQTGGLGGKLDNTQVAFIQTKIEELRNAEKAMIDRIAGAGHFEKQMDEAVVRLEAQRIANKNLISDIEDTDSATAITNLDRDDLAVRQTLKVLAELNETSILEFL